MASSERIVVSVETRSGVVLTPDLSDLSDLNDQPASPARTLDEQGNTVPFKVYAAIASSAIELVVQNRHDPEQNTGEVDEQFKRLCARQGKPYDGRLAQKAVDAAMFSRNKARTELARLMAGRGATA